LNLSKVGGKKAKSKKEPSKGGIGTKLKRAKVKFTQTIKAKISFKFLKKTVEGKILIKTEKNKAKKKLDKGPAIATLAESFSGFLKL
jgi:hypothetical protein